MGDAWSPLLELFSVGGGVVVLSASSSMTLSRYKAILKLIRNVIYTVYLIDK